MSEKAVLFNFIHLCKFVIIVWKYKNMIDNQTAEHYYWGNNCDGWHLLKSEDLSIIQERVPPGCSETMHYHKKSFQFFYILSGKCTLKVGDKIFELRAQQGCPVPPMIPHQLLNEGSEDLHFLVISSPKSHDDKVIVTIDK